MFIFHCKKYDKVHTRAAEPLSHASSVILWQFSSRASQGYFLVLLTRFGGRASVDTVRWARFG
eukprot:9043610-Pyramimonas_sp.AAC.1